MAENEINEIGEELNIDEFDSNLVNNVITKPKEFDESSRRNPHFLRPIYLLVGRMTNFSFKFIPRKITSLKEIKNNILNIVGTHNMEETFEHWEGGMNDVLNLSTSCSARNFLTCIEHSLASIMAD